MKIGKYSKADLEYRNHTPAEKDRLRGIYDDLVALGNGDLPKIRIKKIQ